MAPSTPRIVLLERDDTARELYTEYLVGEGLRVRAEALFDDAVAALKKGGVPLVVAGIAPGGATVGQLAAAIRRVSPHTALLALLGREAAEGTLRAVRDGALEALTKPIGAEALLLSVHRCLETAAMLERDPEMQRMVETYQAARRLQRVYDAPSMGEALLDAAILAAGADAGLALAPASIGAVLVAARQLDESTARDLAAGFDPRALAERPDPVTWWASGSGPLGPGDAVAPAKTTKAKTAARSADAVAIRVGAPGKERLWVALLYKQGSKGAAELAAKEPAARAALFSSLALYASEAEFALATASKYAEGAGELTIDPLTDLADGRTLSRTLARELARVTKNGGAASVLSIGVDGLEAVRDTHGGLAGGQALVEASRILLRAVRDVDIVARTGPNDFGVILFGTAAAGAAIAAARIHRTFASHRFLAREGLDLRLSVTIGVAAWPDHGDTAPALLEAAQTARAGGSDEVAIAAPAARSVRAVRERT